MLGTKRIIALMLLAAIPLMGFSCAGTSWKVTGKCKTGGECEIGGEIGGTLPKQKQTLLESIFFAGDTIDAGSFNVDVSESSVSVPNTGNVTVRLVDSASSSIVASSNFPWVLNGASIVLANPTAVNDWAMQYGGTADSVQYDLSPFQTTQDMGINILAVAAIYDESVRATDTETFRGTAMCKKNKQGIIYCP